MRADARAPLLAVSKQPCRPGCGCSRARGSASATASVTAWPASSWISDSRSDGW